MLSTQKYHDDTYLAESWILYGIGVFVILLRWLVRIRTVGISNFQGDDYLTFVVLACYTSDAVAVKHIQHHGSNVDWTKEEMMAMTDQERGWIAYGSKLQFLCWCVQSIGKRVERYHRRSHVESVNLSTSRFHV